MDTNPSKNKQLENKMEQIKFSSKDYYYSHTLDKYIAYQPLKIGNRIVKAAQKLAIPLDWDDEGRIRNITYINARRLLDELGGTLLSPKEYWQVYHEALNSNNQQILEEICSSQSTEWLDVIFEKDRAGNTFMIEHPAITMSGQSFQYWGEKKAVAIPYARPGWFDPEQNIDPATGLPKQVDIDRAKGTPAWSSTTWKYWSVFKINEPLAGIRGYVTSSGTPSLDIDIPVEAKQPVLMLRECRQNLLDPAINPELISKANALIESYLKTIVEQPAIQNPIQHETFYHQREKIIQFLDKNGPAFIACQDQEAQKIKEKFIDMLGIIRLLAIKKQDENTLRKINLLAQTLFPIQTKKIDYQNWRHYIGQNLADLQSAIANQNKIVFVMGHKNPDTDTAISCLTEAYRNHLLDPQTTYLPVIQGSRIPDEIQRLLGKELTEKIILSDQPDYQTAAKSGQARWILVDQNVSDVQRFAISIVDHHLLSPKAKKQDIAKTWEMVGSTTALIAQKFHGMGLDLDQTLAKIFYGATLMDTENRSPKKMTYKDKLIMNQLQQTAQIRDDQPFYQDLMSHLLNTDDAELLFNRDYKQDWGIFGFAVAKVKGAFGPDGAILKPNLLNRLVELAKKNNQNKNFPLTIVKVADYLENNQTVNRERVYLIFNQYVLPEFKETMFQFITAIIQHTFNHQAQIERTSDSIDFWGVGDQLSRKVTAPFIEPIVEAFNEYYYSPSTKLYVKRDFLKANDQVQKAARDLNLNLSIDREERLNNITYHEAKLLLNELGYTAMSLAEYWKILSEAKEMRDEQMSAHLQSPGFVEFLDTIIENHQTLIDHPQLMPDAQGYQYLGDKKTVEIITAEPGLIYPEDINPVTGLPNHVQDPHRYGDKRIWRYWSPDAPYCIPTRGYIFLLMQPSFDCKIHPDDALPNLGIRPCRYHINPPQVEIIADENGVRAQITRSN